MSKHSGWGSWARVVLVAVLSIGVISSRAEAKVVGVLEAPAGIASGVGNVAGWVYANGFEEEILQPIEVFIDGEKAFELPCCSARGDVKAAHPEAPLETGFSGGYNWGLLEPGMHDVDVVVKSSLGHVRTFTVKITTVRFEELTFLSRLRFTGDSECTHGNDSPDGEHNANIRCSQVLVEKKDGTARLCLGSLTISWDTATQSFKMTSGCTPGCTEHADCDDGVFCNGVESCDIGSGLCVALSSCPPFLDGCTLRGGLCDEATDSCLDVPDHTACDDGVFCNGVESCDVVSGGCVAVSSCPPTLPTGCVTPLSICDEPTDMCLDDLDDAKCPTGDTCQPDGSCLP